MCVGVRQARSKGPGTSCEQSLSQGCLEIQLPLLGLGRLQCLVSCFMVLAQGKVL